VVRESLARASVRGQTCRSTLPPMERVVRIFESHAEAAEADRAFYRSLSPQQRLDLQLDLIARYREGLGEAAARFERVCRVVSLSRR
jgi:hypothetical protein